MVGSNANMNEQSWMMFLCLSGLDGNDIFIRIDEIVAIRNKHVYTKAGKFDVQQSAKEIADKLTDAYSVCYGR